MSKQIVIDYLRALSDAELNNIARIEVEEGPDWTDVTEAAVTTTTGRHIAIPIARSKHVSGGSIVGGKAGTRFTLFAPPQPAATIPLPPSGVTQFTGLTWDEAADDEPAADEPGHDCAWQGHVWIDAGVRKAWCKHCPAEGEWEMGFVRRVRLPAAAAPVEAVNPVVKEVAEALQAAKQDFLKQMFGVP